jgi:hypothetical protein
MSMLIITVMWTSRGVQPRGRRQASEANHSRNGAMSANSATRGCRKRILCIASTPLFGVANV